MFNLSEFSSKVLKKIYDSEITLKKYDLGDPTLLEELIIEIKKRKKVLDNKDNL